MSTLGDVLTRYDELAVLLTSIAARPVSDDDQARRAAAVLHREARLLDAGRLAAWLSTFTDDAVLWVPLAPHAHPGTDQSWYLDDRRRLAERVAWHADPTAWGQHPASETVRSIGTIEAWATPVGLVAHSTFTMVEQRKGEVQVVAGRQIHELVGADLRCRSKILVVPQLADGLCNPSFLL